MIHKQTIFATLGLILLAISGCTGFSLLKARAFSSAAEIEKNLWNELPKEPYQSDVRQYAASRGYEIREDREGVGAYVHEENRAYGSSRIVVDLDSYLITYVDASFGFDESGKLIKIHVRKMQSLF